MINRRVVPALAVVLAMSVSCAQHQSDEAPPLTGPSGPAQSVSITATPDRITQDGQSKSTVNVKVFGPNGVAVRSIEVRLDMVVNGVLQDFGTLSQKTIVTGSDGQASAVYTAPPAPPPGQNSGTSTVSIRAIPVGTDALASSITQVDIRLVPPGVILPPADTPTAGFTITPTPVALGVAAIFDGSKSCPGAADATGNCLASSSQIVNYSWSFGDGSSGSGRTASHIFRAIGSFSVTLTVTNNRGLSASATQVVAVGTLGSLSAAFTFSPSPAVAGDTLFFNAATSTAAPGHAIVKYDWSWGDGLFAPNGGSLPSHLYPLPGTFTVTLTVTDDTGQQNTASNPVTVLAPGAAGGPTAAFTFLPSSPTTVGTTVTFDASTSTDSSGVISSWVWNFGDQTVPGSGKVVAHPFLTASPAAGFTVTLTVTDSNAKTASTTRTIVVN
jgi:PKD repeat protein